MSKIQIVGAGIGGLSAALACAQRGHDVAVFERSAQVTEVGAGVQLGPNVTKLLHAWGLEAALRNVAAYPAQLQVNCALTGLRLGGLRLGDAMVRRYGAPYLTIARADLHALLLKAVMALPNVRLHWQAAVAHVLPSSAGVQASYSNHPHIDSEVLVGADGGFSSVRRLLWADGTPTPTGHLAYRAMVLQSELPAPWRSDGVTVWLGPKLHVVHYPVRGGAWLNVVAIVHGQVPGDLAQWDHSANGQDLQHYLAGTCAPLQALMAAIDTWRLWPLSIRAPMQGAHEHAKGRVALLGDAAHPMVPYLAQGAGMAIEDAAALAAALSPESNAVANDPAAQLQRYAQARWQRNARVQARALRNGNIFHATGLMRLGRNAAMKLLGENLLDMPWLYGGAAPQA